MSDSDHLPLIGFTMTEFFVMYCYFKRVEVADIASVEPNMSRK